MNTIIKNIRLTSHQLLNHKFETPKELVSCMGAIQAQDFNMAKWAIGIRLKSCTEQEIEDAFNRWDFLRTHIMRPTWHFVSSENIRWLLMLTGQRVKAACNSYAKGLNIEEQEYTRCYNLLEKVLQNHNYLTREELAERFSPAGFNVPYLNLYLSRAEADGIICSGSLKEKKQTYALLEERAPKRKDIHKEEALALLAQRYLRSHSPATIEDFIWWSGLTIKDCKHAFGLIENELIKDCFDSSEFYIHETYKEPTSLDNDVFHFLPSYDEYLISYKNRTNVLDLEHHSKAFNNWGIFQPVILYNGHTVGNWKKVKKAKKIGIDITFWDTKLKVNKESFTLAEMKFQNYNNK